MEQGKSFILSTYPKGKTRLIISDDEGNFGYSDFFEVSGKIGTEESPESIDNYYQEIQPITLKKISEEHLGNEEKIREFLGMKREEFQIVYPTK